jgi:uncharacterized protein YkwD
MHRPVAPPARQRHAPARTPRRRPVAILGALALLALITLSAGPPPGRSARAADIAEEAVSDRRDPDLRGALLRQLDAERAAAGAPPLHPSAALERAAQRHVQEVAARGSLGGEHRDGPLLNALMKEAGYDAHQWAENLLSGTASAAELVRGWSREDADGTFRRLLDPGYSDVGIGVGRLDGEPLYSILIATSQGTAFTRDTADLHDLQRVRADLIARINAERRRAGLAPLAESGQLDLAAQHHADNMLARSFFAHRDPAGRTVRERARDAGYEWRGLGENIAEGQLTVAEAVTAWMHSTEHRDNILNPMFHETGVGLTLGRDPHGRDHRVLWVQVFGLPR